MRAAYLLKNNVVAMLLLMWAVSATIASGGIQTITSEGSVQVGKYKTLSFNSSSFRHIGVSWELDPSLQGGQYSLLLLDWTEYTNYSAGQPYKPIWKVIWRYNQTSAEGYSSRVIIDLQRDAERYAFVVDNTLGNETLIYTLKLVQASKEEIWNIFESGSSNYYSFNLPPFLILVISTGGGLIVLNIRRKKR